MEQFVLSRVTVKAALDQAPTHFSLFSDGDFVIAAARIVNPHEPFFLLQKLLHVKTQRRSYKLTCFGTVDTWGCLLKMPYVSRTVRVLPSAKPA